MSKTIKIMFVFFFVVFSVNAHGQSVVDSATINVLKESFKVYQGDTVISGLSIGFATDMLANGASGKSLEQLTNFLGTSVENKNAELHEKIINLPKVLEISNSIWGNNFKTSYKSLLTEILDVSVEKSPSNTSVINDWIAEKTHNKINSVLKPKQTEPLDLYLVNTVYFKDDWKTKFDKKYTQEKNFHSLSSGNVKVSMMHETYDMLYAENSKVQSVKIPYEHDGFMIIYLPKEYIDFNEFISNLSVKDLDLDYSRQEVKLYLPKFAVEHETDVKQIFLALGIDDIFNEETTDLKGLVDTTDNYPHVSKIAHKAVVEMAEEGTTAAAATAVELEIGITSADIIIPEPSILFVANRPFLFFITQGDFIGFYTGDNK